MFSSEFHRKLGVADAEVTRRDKGRLSCMRERDSKHRGKPLRYMQRKEPRSLRCTFKLVHLRAFALSGSARDALGKELLREHRFRKRCSRTVKRSLGLPHSCAVETPSGRDRGSRCLLFGRE